MNNDINDLSGALVRTGRFVVVFCVTDMNEPLY